MPVDDAHSSTRAALTAMAGVELADLNETELDHACDALDALCELDAALAERSSFEAMVLGREERVAGTGTGGGDE